MSNTNNTPKTVSAIQKLCGIALFLIIAALTQIIVSCKNTPGGPPSVDFEKANAAITAATNAAIDGYASGLRTSQVKQKAISAGLATLKTEESKDVILEGPEPDSK